MSTRELLVKTVVDGDHITLENVAAMLPHRFGKPCNARAVRRWATVGVKTLDGRTVRLQTVRVCDNLVTTRAALETFLLEQQEPCAASA